MSQPVAFTSALLDGVLTLLAPLFLTATGGDMATARETVRSTLAGYPARNDNELRLAALGVAFGLGALDALSKAADRALSLDQIMDLRDNATALSQAGDRAQTMLDTLRRRRLAHSGAGSGSGALPTATATGDLLAFPRSQAADPVSGPQRQGFQARQGAPRGGQKMH